MMNTVVLDYYANGLRAAAEAAAGSSVDREQRLRDVVLLSVALCEQAGLGWDEAVPVSHQLSRTAFEAVGLRLNAPEGDDAGYAELVRVLAMASDRRADERAELAAAKLLLQQARSNEAIRRAMV